MTKVGVGWVQGTGECVANLSFTRLLYAEYGTLSLLMQ